MMEAYLFTGWTNFQPATTAGACISWLQEWLRLCNGMAYTNVCQCLDCCNKSENNFNDEAESGFDSDSESNETVMP